MNPIDGRSAAAMPMSSQASAKKQSVSVVPFDIETSKAAAEKRTPSEEGIITQSHTIFPLPPPCTAFAVEEERLPALRRCCDCICNSCLCRGIVFGGNPCCGMRTASIVCNVIAMCWTAMYVAAETLSFREEFWNQYADDYQNADDFTSLSPEEQDEWIALIDGVKLTFYLEMALSYAGLLCLLLAIVGNAKYQWNLVAPLLVLRVLAFSIIFAPTFIFDGSSVYLLLLSYPNWKFVSEVRKGILARPASSGGHQSLPTEENFGHPVV